MTLDGVVYTEKFRDENVTGIIYKMYGKKKVTLGQMKDGIKEGKWTKWYWNGQKKEEGTYKNGKQDGLFTSWYENGQKSEEITYKDGEMIEWTLWDENGNEY